MEHKSLDQLRALARAAKLRGYSGLRKNQLIELLKKHKARSSADTSARPSTPKKAVKSNPARRKASTRTTISPEKSSAPRTLASERSPTVEERIESAKFEMAPPGVRFVYPAPVSSNLHEDIDHLPTPNEPVLCLLPQKPGVVHAYWVLQRGTATKHLRLRLCRATDEAIELVQETEIPGERGYWYFHIPETIDTGNFFVQLGYYDAAGKFATAIHRGTARIPSLRASDRIDRRWWISDQEFQKMYLRAGGVVRGARLLWPGSSSSSPQK